MFLIDDLFKGLGARKQAKEQAAANERKYAAEKASWEGGQDVRGGRLDAVRGLLGGLQGHLAAGAPSYQFDPSAFAAMKTRVPFAGSLPADPSKGATWNMLGDMAGAAGNAALTYFTGGLNQPSSGMTGGQAFQAGLTGAPVPFDPKFGQITAPTLR